VLIAATPVGLGRHRGAGPGRPDSGLYSASARNPASPTPRASCMAGRRRNRGTSMGRQGHLRGAKSSPSCWNTQRHDRPRENPDRSMGNHQLAPHGMLVTWIVKATPQVNPILNTTHKDQLNVTDPATTSRTNYSRFVARAPAARLPTRRSHARPSLCCPNPAIRPHPARPLPQRPGSWTDRLLSPA